MKFVVFALFSLLVAVALAQRGFPGSSTFGPPLPSYNSPSNSKSFETFVAPTLTVASDSDVDYYSYSAMAVKYPIFSDATSVSATLPLVMALVAGVAFF